MITPYEAIYKGTREAVVQCTPPAYRLQKTLKLGLIPDTLDDDSDEYFIRFNVVLAFHHACLNGHLHIARWIWERFSPNNPNLYEDRAFCDACSNGHLHVARWLLRIFPDLRRRYNHADSLLHDTFVNTCSHWHMHVVKWLHKEFPCCMTTRTICSSFWWACMKGCISIAKWLMNTYPVCNYTSMMDNLFSSLCNKGYLHVLQWLVRERKNIPTHPDHDMFLYSCRSGHFRVVKWLYAMFPSITQYPAQMNRTFSFTCYYRQFHIARWLLETFPTIDPGLWRNRLLSSAITKTTDSP